MAIKDFVLTKEKTTMNVIQFGSGKKHMIMIPGLGDGLSTVKGLALPFALLYRIYCREYTVTCISRCNTMPENYSIKEMADDIIWAMDQLKIEKADIYGVSMGGMIAQHIAIDYPERTNKLVLSVTGAACNSQIKECIERWLNMVDHNQNMELMKDNVISMYTDEYCRKNLWMVKFTGHIKPKSYHRFKVMSKAILNHHTLDHLHEIKCPVLIIAGGKDKVVTPEASYQMKECIPHAELMVYPDYGHAVYDEAKDYDAKILEFLKK